MKNQIASLRKGFLALFRNKLTNFSFTKLVTLKTCHLATTRNVVTRL